MLIKIIIIKRIIYFSTKRKVFPLLIALTERSVDVFDDVDMSSADFINDQHFKAAENRCDMALVVDWRNCALVHIERNANVAVHGGSFEQQCCCNAGCRSHKHANAMAFEACNQFLFMIVYFV